MLFAYAFPFAIDTDRYVRPSDASATRSPSFVDASGVPSSASVVRTPRWSSRKWLPSYSSPSSEPPIIGGWPTGTSAVAAANSSAARSMPYGTMHLPHHVDGLRGSFQQRFRPDRRAGRLLHPEVGRHRAVAGHPLELRPDRL